MISDTGNPEISTPGSETSGQEDDMSLRAFGNRLSIVLSCFGSRREASNIAGVSIDQLNAYVKGRNAAPFLVIARLAIRAQISLDWLATGQGAMRPGDIRVDEEEALHRSSFIYDEELLIEIIQSGEEFFERKSPMHPDSTAKARVFATLYRHACRRRLIGGGGNVRRLRGMAEIDLQMVEELLGILK